MPLVFVRRTDELSRLSLRLRRAWDLHHLGSCEQGGDVAVAILVKAERDLTGFVYFFSRVLFIEAQDAPNAAVVDKALAMADNSAHQLFYCGPQGARPL